MAVLSKSGISNNETIQASHITQSIDALTGQVTNYDIIISGSLGVTGSFSILHPNDDIRVIYRGLSNTKTIEQHFLIHNVQDWIIGQDWRDNQFKISSNDDSFVSGSYVRLSIDETTGNVGIGITSSLARLHVSGNLMLWNGNTNVAISNSSDFAQISPFWGTRFTTNGHSSGIMLVGNSIVSSSVLIGTSYSTSNGGPVNGLSVEGNVGVGTTSPTNKLDVSGSTIIRGAITSSGAISSSAGLFGTTLLTTSAITSAGLFSTTLLTTGAITSSGAISSSAGLFGTTLLTTGAITSSGAISSSAGLFSTALRTTGAITASVISASSNITASSIFANNYRTTTANLTTVGSVVIDANVTGAVTWVANFTANVNLSASMPQDGLFLDVFVVNTSASEKKITLCASTSSVTGPFTLITCSVGSVYHDSNFFSIASIPSYTNARGGVFIRFRRIGNIIVAGEG